MSTTAIERIPSDTRRVRGFTVVELMLVISVAAILLVVALPSFSTMLQRNRITSAADHLYVSLAEARGEAVKRRTAVTVCPSADSATCRADGDWSEGWLIRVPATGVTIKAVPSDSLANGVDIGCAAAVEDGVTFAATGATIDSGTSGSFWICHANSSVPSRQVNVSLSGRVESTTREGIADCSAS